MSTATPSAKLLTQSLSRSVSAWTPNRAALFDLLRSGSTKDVVELLAPFRPRARNEAFMEGCIMVKPGAVIEEANNCLADGVIYILWWPAPAWPGFDSCKCEI